MESPTDTFLRWFRRWKCHVTVRLSRFVSVGHSIGKIVWKKSTSPHRCNFSNKLYRLSAIRSVYTDGRISSIYTDRVGDGIISIDKNYRWKNYVDNFVGFHQFSGSTSKALGGGSVSIVLVSWYRLSLCQVQLQVISK